MESQLPKQLSPPKPTSQVQLRYIGALQEAGFSVERRQEHGREFLIYGFGKAALAPKLDSCVKKLANKIQWSGDPEAIGTLAQVMGRYENGEFL